MIDNYLQVSLRMQRQSQAVKRRQNTPQRRNVLQYEGISIWTVTHEKTSDQKDNMKIVICKVFTKKKKQSYIKSKLTENKSNLKEIWRMINELLGKSKRSNTTNPILINDKLMTDDHKMSNHFNTYFSSLAKDLVNNIPNTSVHFTDYLTKPKVKSIFLKPTTLEELQNIITTIKPKFSCGMDDIPSKIVKFTPYNILQGFIFFLACHWNKGNLLKASKLPK